jgi:hypothetical protein
MFVGLVRDFQWKETKGINKKRDLDVHGGLTIANIFEQFDNARLRPENEETRTDAQ